MAAPPSTKYAVHKSASQSLTFQVNELPVLDLVSSRSIDHFVPKSNRMGFGTDAAQRVLHSRVALPALQLTVRLGARMARSSTAQCLDSSTLRASAILKVMVAFLYANADQLNLREVSLSDAVNESDECIHLILKTKLRRLHTLAATATPLRPHEDSSAASEGHPADPSDETASPTLRLGVDLIWSTHQKRTRPDRVKESDFASLSHALAQTSAVPAPLLAPLMNALRQTLCNSLLQDVKICLLVRERPLLACGGDTGSEIVEHRMELPLFNGVWLDREESMVPLFRSLAQSLTNISRSADRRHQNAAQTSADSPLVRRWKDIEKRIGLGAQRVSGLDSAGLDEADADLRFLSILNTLRQSDYAQFTHKLVKPKLVDRISQSSFEQATRTLQKQATISPRLAPASSPIAQPAEADEDERFGVDIINFPVASSEPSSARASDVPMFWDEPDSDAGVLADVEDSCSWARLQADMAFTTHSQAQAPPAITPAQPSSPFLLATDSPPGSSFSPFFDWNPTEAGGRVGIEGEDQGLGQEKKEKEQEEVVSELEAMGSDEELNQSFPKYATMPLLSEDDMDQHNFDSPPRLADTLMSMDTHASSTPNCALMRDSDDEDGPQWSHGATGDCLRSSSPLFSMPDQEHVVVYMSE
ncbi:unnamed protein product [Tilletia laevis]|nr:hypothetical protein CF336_g4047 [Tilletia laevis]KAE8202714.1 hypothetical protein CF335_g3307 [Tilletia laevis]CAD6909855.1 unnamed protein product [Tilletia laevis]CAD6959075.1 unnamed protein product [Tilletia controversa]CAD6975340.1 unnamed protein product [Tilletia controversa]